MQWELETNLQRFQDGNCIGCVLEATSEQPVCTIRIGGKKYVMPIANMSDSRFFGEAEDGSTVEGYRISYD